jgi:CBS domain-containing protein
MLAREIMSSKLEKIGFNATICEAAEKMRLADIGFLPVERAGKIVGIVTDRDIVVRAIAYHLNPDTTAVGKVMTSDVVYCYDNDDLEEAEEIMEEKQIRRLVVLNNDDMPVGVLSLSDFVTKAKDENLACRAMGKICESVGSKW